MLGMIYCFRRFYPFILLVSSFFGVIAMTDKQHEYNIIENLSLQTIKLLEKYFDSEWIVEKLPMLKLPSIQSFLSVLVISLAPFFLLGLIPSSSCHGGSKVMRLLLGFSVGSLLGDTVLHIIPHALEEIINSHDGTNDNFSSGWFTKISYPLMGGLLTFYVIETIIRIIKVGSHQAVVASQKKKDDEPKPSTENISSSKKNKPKSNTLKSEINSLEQCNNINVTPSKKKKLKSKAYGRGSMSSSASLNLVSDFIHNLLDGMAISFAYSKDVKLGIVTTFSVLLHEIPHEISDFTILIKCGYLKWKAALIQLITAFGAIMGASIGLYISQHGINGEYPYWVLPFTAGGFIYVACVCVIPEMLNDQHPSLFRLSLEVIGMICGVSLMEIFNNIHIH